jgi:hypothetical protein
MKDIHSDPQKHSMIQRSAKMVHAPRLALGVSLILLLCATALSQSFLPAEVVYDPFNEVHFVAQLSELVKTYVELTTINRQMAYNAQILNNKSQWVITFNNWARTTAPDSYFLNAPWLNAVNTGLGVSQAYGISTAPLHIYNLATVPPAFYPRIEQQYAAVQLIDGTTQQGLQTVGQYKGEELRRASTITSLGTTIGSSSAANNSEVATLGTISTASILALQEAHDANAINASILEQRLQEQNQRRQALAYSINSDIQFRQDEPAAFAAHNTGTTLALRNLVIP